jgi:hypothetical protein
MGLMSFQVLLHKGRVGMIDFDSWHRAEPAVDLALFLTSIRDVGLSVVSKAATSPPDVAAQESQSPAILTQLDALCDGFLAQYAALLPITRSRVALSPNEMCPSSRFTAAIACAALSWRVSSTAPARLRAILR